MDRQADTILSKAKSLLPTDNRTEYDNNGLCEVEILRVAISEALC